jgi:hypothetical protein
MSDISVTTAQVSLVADTVPQWRSGIAGEALAAGDFVYMNSSTGKLWKSDASGTGDSTEVLGMVLAPAAAGSPVSYLFQGAVYGFDLSGVGYGKKLYLSVTAGAIADAAPVEGGATTKTIGRCLPLNDGGVGTKTLFVDINQA